MIPRTMTLRRTRILTRHRMRMKRLLTIFAALTLAHLGGMPTGAWLCAQSRPATAPHKILLSAEMKPGQVLRYELEAGASFLPISDASGAILTPMRAPCDYSLSAIVTLRPQVADKDGNIPVEARYSETRVTSVRCAMFSPEDFQKRLAALQASAVMFRVGPHGETALSHSGNGYFRYWDGGDLLRKVTQDLLQTEFSPQPVAKGASWKPRGQFAYSHDRALKDLELSGSDLRFRNLVPVDGKTCAWVTSQYVFSPVDLPAVGTASGGRVVPAAGNNAVAAVLHISLLLDPESHHVAWLHRSQTIDNKLTLASPYDDSNPGDDPAEPDDPQDGENPMPDLSSMRSDNPGRYPFMTFHFQEEARARLLPDERTAEWLAALKRFEGNPEPESGTIPVPATKTLLPNPIVQAAKPAVVKRTSRVMVDSDTLVATPAGFTRYEKGLCRDAWFCATVSVALPGDVQISEDTPLHTVYLAQKGELEVSVAVGPALDRRHAGLTDDEELRKMAEYYLANYIWMAAKPGIGTDFTSATLDGYPGLITNFSAKQRDLANIHGVLGLMLTPWGKVVPVSCSSDHALSAELQALCEKVITTVSLRR
jgi:hypothetical protein